jgi:hypothetical protein
MKQPITLLKLFFLLLSVMISQAIFGQEVEKIKLKCYYHERPLDLVILDLK